VVKATKEQGFWTTLPGVLTGGAALLTAITGLIVGLYQYGVLGSRHGQTGDPRPSTMAAQASEPNGAKPPVESLPQPPAAIVGQQKTQEATVAITAKDGTTTTVMADSLRQMREWDQSLHLLSGRNVAFAKIKAIEVLRDYEDQAKIQITLLDGSVMEDAVALGSSTLGFHGETDLGGFDIRMEQLQRIVFRR